MPEAAERPWRLEVWEDDTWRVWTTYIHRDKAESRLDRLQGKGIVARVEGPATCIVCGDEHAPPYDGTCLI